MKKVTLNELVKLPSFKIRVTAEQAMEVQKAVLEAGFKWQGGSTEVRTTANVYKLFFLDGEMSWMGNTEGSNKFFDRQLVKEVELI